jgi:uncharacterized tellurite resistance protein B-like protein
MCGEDSEVGFSKETFKSEKETAYNNFAIAYNLKGRRGLPRDVDLHKMLDVYLGCCSLEVCVEALAVAAATLANGGVCPITGKEVFPAHVVRYVLSETMTCGMYDQSGHFAVQVGLPSKSGVSGVLLVIVPNVFGYATFSPRLNSNGNSVRGIEFSKRLVNSYRVHLFEPLRAGNTGAKVDPRTNGRKTEKTRISRMAWALSVGDVWATRLRDIYLFAVVQAGLASREGLSDHMRGLIADNYQLTYQVEEFSTTLLEEVVDAIQSSPGANMKILENLVKQTSVPDFMRSIIMQSLIDGAMVDGHVDDIEKNIIVRIGVLLGIDRSVALMEINRFEKHAIAEQEDRDRTMNMTALQRQRSGSGGTTRRRADLDPLNVSEHSHLGQASSTMGMGVSSGSPGRGGGGFAALTRKMSGGLGHAHAGHGGGIHNKDQMMDLQENMVERADRLQKERLKKTSQKQGMREATTSTFIGNHANGNGKHGNGTTPTPSATAAASSDIMLRREILRLRRKVDTLSHMLHDARLRGQQPASLEPAQHANHCVLKVVSAGVVAHEED